MKRSSNALPVCRLPSQRPVSIALLCGILAVSMLCLLASASPPGVSVLLAAGSALYAGACIRQILRAEAFELLLAADGRLTLLQARQQKRINAVHWRDFGYLAVLHCRHDAKPAAYFWWRHRMPALQRRDLRRIIGASAKTLLQKPPSLIVNPLL